MIKDHLNKNNPHHAYLIEGDREEVIPEVLKFLKELGVKLQGNSDFSQILLDTFKIDDARELRSLCSSKTFSTGRRVFLVFANNFLIEAQNSLLKIFEEPSENTIFFIITPDASSMLKTLISRFYFIAKENNDTKSASAAEFIKMPLSARIEFLKELLVETDDEDEEGNEIVVLDSVRAKAMSFLNTLEYCLHDKSLKEKAFDHGSFEQIFKVREFLRQPGSSAKTLMESVALVLPVIQ
jgi:hypothetical protein